MQRIALDIETAPTPEQLALIPQPEVKTGNLKDPAKIKEKEDGARAEQLSKAALDPHFSRILAVALAHPERAGFPISRVIIRDRTGNAADQDAAERDLLCQVWQVLGASADQIVTFNGAGFDIPYLMRRSLLLGVRPVRIEIDRHVVCDPASSHLDVFQLLQRWEVGNGFVGNPLSISHTLQFYAAVILGKKPPYDVDKSALADLPDATITELALWDAQTTLELAEVVAAHYR